jgi:large subunit ribosomal protein L16
MFEIDGVPAELAAEAIARGAAKLPLETRFVRRVQEAGGEAAA